VAGGGDGAVGHRVLLCPGLPAGLRLSPGSGPPRFAGPCYFSLSGIDAVRRGY